MAGKVEGRIIVLAMKFSSYTTAEVRLMLSVKGRPDAERKALKRVLRVRGEHA